MPRAQVHEILQLDPGTNAPISTTDLPDEAAIKINKSFCMFGGITSFFGDEHRSEGKAQYDCRKYQA